MSVVHSPEGRGQDGTFDAIFVGVRINPALAQFHRATPRARPEDIARQSINCYLAVCPAIDEAADVALSTADRGMLIALSRCQI
jgi:hypothetical protein